MPLPGYDPSFYRGPSSPSTTRTSRRSWTPWCRCCPNRTTSTSPATASTSSIPRMPQRYPMTTEYYRRLFAGDLGFELVATFASYPTLGPWTINDDRAEEAFTVYDHPKVLIFKKTADFSPERVRQILAAVPLDDVRPGAPHPGRADAADDAGGPPRGEHRRGHLVGHVLPGRPGQPPGPPAVVGGPDRPGLARRPPAVAGPAPPPRPGLRPGPRPGAAGRLLDRLVPRRLPPPALDAGHPPAGRAPAGAGRRAGPAARRRPGGGSGWPGCARSGGCCWPRRPSSSAPTSCSCSSARPTPTSGTPCGGARSRWSSPTSTR